MAGRTFSIREGICASSGSACASGSLETRQSQAQIGAISTPICAFYHHSLDGFSIVPIQTCQFQFYSGLKVGQGMRTLRSI